MCASTSISQGVVQWLIVPTFHLTLMSLKDLPVDTVPIPRGRVSHTPSTWQEIRSHLHPTRGLMAVAFWFFLLPTSKIGRLVLQVTCAPGALVPSLCRRRRSELTVTSSWSIPVRMLPASSVRIRVRPLRATSLHLFFIVEVSYAAPSRTNQKNTTTAPA